MALIRFSWPRCPAPHFGPPLLPDVQNAILHQPHVAWRRLQEREFVGKRALESGLADAHRSAPSLAVVIGVVAVPPSTSFPSADPRRPRSGRSLAAGNQDCFAGAAGTPPRGHRARPVRGRTCRAGVPMATIYGEHHVKKEEANERHQPVSRRVVAAGLGGETPLVDSHRVLIVPER